jgi:hypothetical protein
MEWEKTSSLLEFIYIALHTYHDRLPIVPFFGERSYITSDETCGVVTSDET